MAEEKEAATAACPFTRLEDLIAIRLRTQTLLQNVRICQIFSKGVHEELLLMKNDTYVRVQSHVDFGSAANLVKEVIPISALPNALADPKSSETILNVVFCGSARAPPRCIPDLNLAKDQSRV